MSLKKYLEGQINNDEQSSKKEFSSYLREKIMGMINEKSYAYDVYKDGKLIDTVFDQATKAEDVKKSLINHDGYDDDIVVKKCRDSKKIKESIEYFTNKVSVGDLSTKPKETKMGTSNVDYVPHKVPVDKLKVKQKEEKSGSKTDYFPNKVKVDSPKDGKKGNNEGGKSSTNYFPNDINVPEYSFEDTVANIVSYFEKYHKEVGDLYSKGAGSTEWHGFVAKVAKEHNLKYTPDEAKRMAKKIYQNKDLPDTTPKSTLKGF